MLSAFYIIKKGTRFSKWKSPALPVNRLSADNRGGCYMIVNQYLTYKSYAWFMFLIIGNNVHELVMRTHFLLQALAGGESPIV